MKFRTWQIAACVAVVLLAGSLLGQSVQAQTYNVLYTFTGDPAETCLPQGCCEHLQATSIPPLMPAAPTGLG